MKSTLWSVAGVVVGFLTAFVLVFAVEILSNVIHPFPEGFQGTREEICKQVETYPAWFLAAVIPMWGFATLAGTWTAGRIGSFHSSSIVGLLLLAALIFNLSMLPYPMWFKGGCLLMIPIAVIFGCRWSMRRPATGTGTSA